MARIPVPRSGAPRPSSPTVAATSSSRHGFGWAVITTNRVFGSPELGDERSVRLLDGRVFVGVVVDVAGATIVFRPWGTTRAMRIARSGIHSIALLGSHRFADRDAVRRAQRDGAPLLVLQPRTEPARLIDYDSRSTGSEE